MKNAREVISEILKNRNISFLSSAASLGREPIRLVVALQKYTDSHAIFLTIDTLSYKVRNFISNPEVCLYFCDLDNQNMVRLDGAVELENASADLPTKVWDYSLAGIDNPEDILLKFSPTGGSCYVDGCVEDFFLT